MTDNPTALYAAWLNAVPQLFRALLPAGAAASWAPAKDDSAPASLPFPVDQVGHAFKVLEGTLTQLYQAYLPLLAGGELSAGPVQALASAGTELFNRLRDATTDAGNAWPGLQNLNALTQFTQPWSSLLQGLVAGAGGNPPGAGSLGIERAFGGLGDALGLRPARETDQAWRELVQSGVAKQRAQLEYFALVAEAWNEGTQRLLQDLKAMGARGERIESLLGFIRLWAKAIDGPLHDAMQSERGLLITAKVIRASSQQRQQLQQVIGLVSEALHVPTRADMDLAYREIQELKRELRQIKKLLPPAAPKKLPAVKEQEA